MGKNKKKRGKSASRREGETLIVKSTLSATEEKSTKKRITSIWKIINAFQGGKKWESPQKKARLKKESFLSSSGEKGFSLVGEEIGLGRVINGKGVEEETVESRVSRKIVELEGRLPTTASLEKWGGNGG